MGTYTKIFMKIVWGTERTQVRSRTDDFWWIWLPNPAANAMCKRNTAIECDRMIIIDFCISTRQDIGRRSINSVCAVQNIQEVIKDPISKGATYDFERVIGVRRSSPNPSDRNSRPSVP
jgi:hypothetical protein